MPSGKNWKRDENLTIKMIIIIIIINNSEKTTQPLLLRRFSIRALSCQTKNIDFAAVFLMAVTGRSLIRDHV